MTDQFDRDHEHAKRLVAREQKNREHLTPAEPLPYVKKITPRPKQLKLFGRK